MIIFIIVAVVLLFVGWWIFFRSPRPTAKEIGNCDNCVLLKKKLKQRTIFIVLMFCLVFLWFVIPIFRPYERPGARYQITYSISPEDSNYAMDIYAIQTRDNQYEVHADVVIGATVPAVIKMRCPAILGTVASFKEAVITCNTVNWLKDRVVVTPGIRGKEYSVAKSIYTKHR